MLTSALSLLRSVGRETRDLSSAAGIHLQPGPSLGPLRTIRSFSKSSTEYIPCGPTEQAKALSMFATLLTPSNNVFDKPCLGVAQSQHGLYHHLAIGHSST